MGVQLVVGRTRTEEVGYVGVVVVVVDKVAIVCCLVSAVKRTRETRKDEAKLVVSASTWFPVVGQPKLTGCALRYWLGSGGTYL